MSITRKTSKGHFDRRFINLFCYAVRSAPEEWTTNCIFGAVRTPEKMSAVPAVDLKKEWVACGVLLRHTYVLPCSPRGGVLISAVSPIHNSLPNLQSMLAWRVLWSSRASLGRKGWETAMESENCPNQKPFLLFMWKLLCPSKKNRSFWMSD